MLEQFFDRIKSQSLSLSDMCTMFERINEVSQEGGESFFSQAFQNDIADLYLAFNKAEVAAGNFYHKYGRLVIKDF